MFPRKTLDQLRTLDALATNSNSQSETKSPSSLEVKNDAGVQELAQEISALNIQELEQEASEWDIEEEFKGYVPNPLLPRGQTRRLTPQVAEPIPEDEVEKAIIKHLGRRI